MEQYLPANDIDTIASTLAVRLGVHAQPLWQEARDFLPRLIAVNLETLGLQRRLAERLCEAVKLRLAEPVVIVMIDAVAQTVEAVGLPTSSEPPSDVVDADSILQPCHVHEAAVDAPGYLSALHRTALQCRVTETPLLVFALHVDLASQATRESTAAAHASATSPAALLCGALGAVCCASCTAAVRIHTDSLGSVAGHDATIPDLLESRAWRQCRAGAANVAAVVMSTHAPSLPTGLLLPPGPPVRADTTFEDLARPLESGPSRALPPAFEVLLQHALPAHRIRWKQSGFPSVGNHASTARNSVTVDLVIDMHVHDWGLGAPRQPPSNSKLTPQQQRDGDRSEEADAHSFASSRERSAWPAGFAGQFDVKSRLESALVAPLRSLREGLSHRSAAACIAAAMRRMHVVPQRGVLVYGPPGSGKTALARALAEAAGLRFIAVQCSGLVSRYVGDSEAGIRGVFRMAREHAPALVLLDDVDAIAQRRAGRQASHTAPRTSAHAHGSIDAEARAVRPEGGGGGGGNVFSGHADALPRAPAPVTVLDRMLATLLNELDGVGLRASDRGDSGSDASGGSGGGPLADYVLVVGTTNRPGVLDEALLRAGRLELHVELPGAPDAASRAAILALRLASLALGRGVTPNALAAETEGWSAAQVARLCDAAALVALQESMAGGGAMSPLLADMLGQPRSPVARAAAADSGDGSGVEEGAGSGVPAAVSSAAQARAPHPLVEMRHFREAMAALLQT